MLNHILLVGLVGLVGLGVFGALHVYVACDGECSGLERFFNLAVASLLCLTAYRFW